MCRWEGKRLFHWMNVPIQLIWWLGKFTHWGYNSEMIREVDDIKTCKKLGKYCNGHVIHKLIANNREIKSGFDLLPLSRSYIVNLKTSQIVLWECFCTFFSSTIDTVTVRSPSCRDHRKNNAQITRKSEMQKYQTLLFHLCKMQKNIDLTIDTIIFMAERREIRIRRYTLFSRNVKMNICS
jgi:hypothetical protein